MVQVELSHNPHKPIVTALAGGLGRREIDHRLATDPFIALDTARLVELHRPGGWASLAALLAREFGCAASGPVEPVPRLASARDDRPAAQRWADYRRDWLAIARAFKRAQTAQQAEAELNREIERLQELGHLDRSGYDGLEP
ncbi:MAG: hypothetical protein HYZ20_03140 [Burkholderiales bacterium]|nr:hypothetical protein [Burkholderiales bacterium]